MRRKCCETARKMNNRQRFNLTFSLLNPQHRKAWRIICEFPERKRTDAVCEMICGYKNQQEMLDKIQETIQNELKSATIQTEKYETEQTEDVGNDILSFLLSL